MSIIPSNTDPLQEYVSGGATPPLTINGLVYNKIYAQTGVLDTIKTNQRTGYTDPNISIVNGSNNLTIFDQFVENTWISSQQFGGPNSPPVILTYNFSSNTYFNIVKLYALNVPCFIELGWIDTNKNWNALPGSSTFVNAGGSDIYTTTDWLPLTYNAPSTQYTPNLAIRITRNQAVQGISNGIPVDLAYSVGLTSVSVRLQVLQESDVPSAVISGTNSVNTQNRFGFLENYKFVNDPIANIYGNDTAFWKCAPQPTGDSIVYFYAQVSDPTPTTINRLYIDPMYSGCKFNIYWTTQSTAGGTVDPGQFTWTPIQRDFNLRKGLYDLPNVTCTYLKFEFTQLIPEAYDLPVDVITKTVNVFPSDVEEYYSQIESNIIDGNSVQYSFLGNNNNPQTSTTTNLNASTLFGLSSNTINNDISWPNLGSLNSSQLGNTTTTALTTNSYITDPTFSYRTIDNNGNYNNVAYNQFLQRRFPWTTVHNYTQITIDQSWHEAYFTGIQYLTAFYEQQFDDIRSNPTNLIASNGTTNGFISQNVNYVGLNPDDTATTKWYSTLDTFTSFNIGALASDWSSFLTDSQVLMNDPSVLLSQYRNNCSASGIGNFGTSTIVAVSGLASNNSYSIRSATYPTSSNEITYTDANFITINKWSGLSGTTVATQKVSWISGTTSGTASGLSVSGGAYTAVYNFTIPGVAASGTTPWLLDFGAPAEGVTGYGVYNPTNQSLSYYFYTGVQVSGNSSGISQVSGTLSAYTQFVNSSNAPVSGTVVPGSTVTFASGSGSNLGYLTSTNYTSSIPTNTIQLVISGFGIPYNLYQLGAFPSPTTTWTSPQDRNNMRVSGVARMFLPFTDKGTYRISLFASNGATQTELVFKQFSSGQIPLNTWFEVQLESFTGKNYSNFYVQITQVNQFVDEVFYVSMLSPFYHPVRFEYSTISGAATNYQVITGPINDPTYFVSTTSGIPASGIQLRMTALDPNVFISGVSVVPYYKSSPYYAELDIDYVGNSKTNEVSSRRAVANKPFFQNTTEVYPLRFNVDTVVGPTTNYVSA